MKTFEYRVEILAESEYRDSWPHGQLPHWTHIDELGKIGWELVTVIIDNGTVMGYFKRLNEEVK